MAKKKVLKADVEINLAFSMVNATMLIMRDVKTRLLNNGGVMRQEVKKDFNDLLKAIDRVLYLEEKFDAAVTRTMGDRVGDEYEMWMEDYNELARLVLLWVEKCDGDEDKKNEVWKTLNAMKGVGIFSQDDIDRFRLKKVSRL